MTQVTAAAGEGAHLSALVVRVGGLRAALPLDAVVEVLPALASSPLSDGPDMVCGVVNLRGAPIPLLSLRERLGLPPVEPDPDHHIVVCEIGDRHVGVWVDAADKLTTVDRAAVVPSSGVAATRHLDGVAMLPDDMLLVYDVRSFLAADDALRLDAALAVADAGGGS